MDKEILARMGEPIRKSDGKKSANDKTPKSSSKWKDQNGQPKSDNRSDKEEMFLDSNNNNDAVCDNNLVSADTTTFAADQSAPSSVCGSNSSEPKAEGNNSVCSSESSGTKAECNSKVCGSNICETKAECNSTACSGPESLPVNKSPRIFKRTGPLYVIQFLKKLKSNAEGFQPVKHSIASL
jgi:hypothetical protein